MTANNWSIQIIILFFIGFIIFVLAIPIPKTIAATNTTAIANSSSSVASDLVGDNKTNNNKTPVMVFGPPDNKIIESKPNENQTKSTNKTMSTSHGPEIIRWKPESVRTNGTAPVTQGPPQIIKGKSNNGTAPVTQGPPQIITGRSTLQQSNVQNQLRLNTPNTITGSGINTIPNINITKEQAAKAEQEANTMLKAYYEKVNQQKVRTVASPATGNTLNTTTMTKNGTSQQQQQQEQQREQQPIIQDNSTASKSFVPTGIPGIP